MAASWFIARHGETVFNAAARMQGAAPHTPLTRSGFAQAEAMGDVLRQRLGTRPAVELWASPTGRALQTLSVICEHLELDWHAAKTDPRLAEMDVGEWGGLYYRDIIAQAGEFVDGEAMLFSRRQRAANGMTRSPSGCGHGSPSRHRSATGCSSCTTCRPEC